MEPSSSERTLVLSYLELRKSLGVIGIALPFILVVGKILLQGDGLLSSISMYYYSAMGGVFVGSLSAIGVFLWSYRGYDIRDSIAGHFAAIFAVGVALFPTTPDGTVTSTQLAIGMLHYTFAGLFFGTLIYFALVLFRKTDSSKPPTKQKLMRNHIYAICGYTMLASIILLALARFLLSDSSVYGLHPIFWLESILVEAFGISWLVKGEAILKDE
jgi:hypothetical protein